VSRLSTALVLLGLAAACSNAPTSEPGIGDGERASSTAYCTPNYSVAPLPNTQSGNFNRTSEVCFVVQNAGPLAFNCSNMAGRTVTVNGRTYSSGDCDSHAGSSVTAPNVNEGKYYFDVSAGGLSYASIAFWAGSGGGAAPGGSSCTATLSAGQKWSDRYNLNVTVTGANDWVVTMTLPSPEVMIATWNINPSWPPPGNVLIAKPNGNGNSWGVTVKHNGNWTWPTVTCISKDPPPPPTIDADVVVDPYGHNPLAAVVNLRGVDASALHKIKVVVAGKDGGQDLERTYLPGDVSAARFDSSDLTFPVAGLHVPVIGLYDGANQVHLIVELDSGTADLTLSITSPLTVPGETTWVPGITLSTADPSRMDPGWTVAEISLEKNAGTPVIDIEWTRRIAYDELGAIRWALRLDGVFAQWGDTFPMTRTRDGTFLTGAGDELVEVNELGRILKAIPLPGYSVHHEIVQIGGADQPVGSPHDLDILAHATKEGAGTVQDRILEVSYTTGAIVQEWDLSTILDPTRTIFTDKQGWTPDKGDWCHANGLAYSYADDEIIVSCRHQGIAKIGRTNSLDWLLAPHAAWKSPWSTKLLEATCSGGACGSTVQDGYDPSPDGSFDWPFGQHSPVLLANGDLLLFDNGASRYFKGGCSFSRAVIYRVDQASMTVRQIAEYVLDLSRSSCFVSNVYRLPKTGDFFVQPGGTSSAKSLAREISADVAADGTVSFGSDVVFDATLDLSAIGKELGKVSAYSYRGHRWEF
jgi:arylsulfate sulfotransferase